MADTTDTPEQMVSLRRSRSISYAHGRGRRVNNSTLGQRPLKSEEEQEEEEQQQQQQQQQHETIAIHAPLHSTVSVESIASKSSLSSARADLFQQSALSADAIPGNIHMSSTQSIEHLIKRYGPVTLIRQLSTDLAQREAELSLARKQYSRKENALIKLLQEMGFTASQVDALLKERMELVISDESFLQDMISDAMEDGLLTRSSVILADSTSNTTKKPIITSASASSSDSSIIEDPNLTLTPPKKTRPHSSSLSSITSQQHNSDNFLQSNSILNAVSNRFLNHVPQPVHDAIVNNTNITTTTPSSTTQNLMPVELENFHFSTLNDHSNTNSDPSQTGYVDQFGFLYDNKQNIPSQDDTLKTTTTKNNNNNNSLTSSSIKSKLQELANGYDKTKQQTNKEWDEFIKRVSLMDTDTSNSGDWFMINGKNISQYKPLHKQFMKLVQNGVPMPYRPKVWGELLGVNHLMNPSEYHTLLGDEANVEAETQIELDLYRTMPFNVFFKDNGPGLSKLQNVLIAFARKYKQIGYCQGMNFIVANLLLVFHEEEEAFWAFVGMVENVLPQGFFNLFNIKRDLALLKKNFQIQLPRLYQHLLDCDVELEPICFNWFISLFTDSVSAHVVFRIWDNLMLNGYVEIQKTSIAMFKIFEERLMMMDDNVEIYEFMKNLNKTNFNLKGSELVRISSGIKIDSSAV